jgi:hypothetical protein
MERSGKGWTLRAKHIDYNGLMTGFGTTVVKISEFKGSMPLTDKSALVEKLVLRGKRYAKLRCTFQEYSGKAYKKDASGYGVETQVRTPPSRFPTSYFKIH